MSVDPNIKQKASYIRTKQKGSEVRESLAAGLEAMSEDVVSTIARQGNVEGQFQEVIDNTTGKDVISAPELIAARNGEANLKARLDKEQQEVTAQLAQTNYEKASTAYVNQLVASLSDNGPYDAVTTVNALYTKYPNGAPGPILVFENNHSYIWNEGSWKDFGVYQGIEVKDGTLTKEKLAFDPVAGKKSTNLYNKEIAKQGVYYYSLSGTETANDKYEGIKYVPLKPNTSYIMSHTSQLPMYGANGLFIRGLNLPETNGKKFTTGNDVYFASISILKENRDVFQLQEGSVLSPYEPYGVKSTDLIIGNKTAGDFAKNVTDVIEQAKKGDRKFLLQLMSKIILEKLNVKIIGDSITAGLGGTGYAQDGQYIFSGFYVNESGHCWANSVRDYMLDKFNVTVKNFGCSGITTKHIISGFDYLVEPDDDVVIIMIGTNNRGLADSSEEDFYTDLITIGNRIKSLGKEVIYMSSIPASEANESTPDKKFHMDDVDNKIMTAAGFYNMEYVSFYKMILEYCDLKNIDINTLLADGLHPNDNGYDVMFYLFCKAFGLAVKQI